MRDEIELLDSPSPTDPNGPLLSVRDLVVHFPTQDGIVKAVDGISFDLKPGDTLGIVGESGSGKSVTSLAIMGLHRGTRANVSGSILLDGTDLISASDEAVRRRRGKDVAMIFQDPLSSLHPYYTIGDQIVEAYLVHHPGRKPEARQRALDMLGLVGIPNPRERIDQYPHEFSGGMRQRAMIAMAMINDPKLLIADEPTTALDVTVQAQILELMKDLQRQLGSAIIMITHDLGVVAHMAHDIMVMYAGRAVETGDVQGIFARPKHPYTVGLLNSMPRLDTTSSQRLVPIVGNPPSLIQLPSGCSFHPRCPRRPEVPGDLCRLELPDLIDAGDRRHVRCFLYGDDGEFTGRASEGYDGAQLPDYAESPIEAPRDHPDSDPFHGGTGIPEGRF